MQWSAPERKPAIVVRYVDSISQIDPRAWDDLLPGCGADWSYFRTVEAFPPPGFRLSAIVAESDGVAVAVAPVFETVYRFDTALQGSARLRRVGDWLFRHLPSLVSMKVLSLGSPLADDSHIGFAARLSAADRDAALQAMLECLRQQARKARIQLVAAKGLNETEANADQPVFARAGFTRVTTIPNVMLDLPYPSIDAYLASLPEGTGSYLKRKWRSAAKVRIEHRDDLTGLEDEINDMFNATLAQSKVDYGDFSRVHPGYFAAVVKSLGPKARVMLCWVDGELLSFQLYVVGKHEVLAKGIGMKYPKAREHNLYFLNWREMIAYCLEHGIERISMSGTTYATKLLMGGRLDRRWIFFRFTNPLLNMILPWLAPAFDYESNDPELKAIRDKTTTSKDGPRPVKDGKA
jgi:hypothetical protein